MGGSSDFGERRGTLAQVRRRLALVRFFLLLERVWRALWPAAVAIGAYLAAALFGLPEALGPFVHIAAFLALLGGCAALAYSRLRRLGWPGEADARRRLERDSGAAHRPLDALFDTPATAAGGAALWRRHRLRMAAAAKKLLPGPPRVSLVAEDPRALRGLVVLLLAVGVLYAGSDAGRRILHAFSPPLAAAPENVRLDAWVTPPDYTGRSPVVLANGDGGGEAAEPVAVPAGSTLTVAVHGADRAPTLVQGKSETALNTVAPGEHGLEAVIESGEPLSIEQSGHALAHWPIELIPDERPSVGFAREPSESRRHALRIDYTLFDDYGVERVRLVLTPKTLEGEPVRLDLPGASTRGEPAERTAYEDLTAHPYAGALVRAVLVAEDAAGQEGESDAHEFRLPMREFSHPVAKELAAIRRDLLRAPERRIRQAERLEDLSRAPEAFDHDLTVFAVLRSSVHRLLSDRREAAVGEVGEMLWETALRLEDGQLSLATRSLRDALDDFARAMESESGSLADAAEALQRQLQNFLAQMAAQQAELAPDGQPPMKGGEMRVVGTDMLQRMIQRMQELAAAGETEAAMRMLEQLRHIAENASTGSMSQADYDRMMAASRAARQLDQLERDQRELLNHTGRQTLLNRLLERRGEPQRPFDGLADRQDDLSDTLSGLGEMLEEGGMQMPENLGEAERAMDEARRALDRRSGPGAVRRQAEAVRAMDEAGEKLRQSLQQAMGRMPGTSGLDPLGRPQPGLSARDFEIPDEMSVKEAERIIEQLRRRMSDPELDEEERAYIRRLLRRF